MSKFVVGDKWRTRGGSHVIITDLRDGTVYPVRGYEVTDPTYTMTFNQDGSYWNDGSDSAYDLVELVSNPPEIEADVVMDTEVAAHQFPTLDNLGEWKYAQGGFELHIDGDIYFGDTPTQCAARYLEAHYSEQNLTVSFTELAEDGV